MSQVEVKGIGISVEGHDVLLSVEDAKVLYEELATLFGRLPLVVSHHLPQPIIIEKDTWSIWGPTRYGSGAGTGDPPPDITPRVWCSMEAP